MSCNSFASKSILSALCTVGNRFNEGRQNVLKDVFSIKKPISLYKAFQCDQNGVIFIIVASTCQKIFPFFRTYTIFI